VLPVKAGIRPAIWTPIEGEPMRVTLDTGALDISRVAALADLDAFGRFNGDLRVHFDARSDDGKVIDIRGSMNSEGVRADLVDGSWVEATADVRVGGTVDQPSVDGGVVVNGGVLRMPEVPPTLHDVQGTALLWGERTQTPRAATAPVDSATAPVDSAIVDRPAPVSVPLIPALDVTLSIPGNLRLVGMGLDIELSGALTARNDDEEIGVVGTLQATRGSYQFLGRRFLVRTGVVSFFGDLDPELDLQLVTTLQTNNYFVHIGGTAQKPRFELSSEPPMSEGDIVSALLFGRPLNELDEGQTALLRERTQQIAAQLGTNLLAQRIGQQIGVDILAVRTAADGEGQALVVGKYLRPDVLVQYERILDEGAAALVRLEYALNRFFKIETTASQGEHSGVELKWSKDY